LEVVSGRFEPFQVGIAPRAIAAFAGDVWVTACGTPGTVLRVDAQTGDVTETIPAGGAVCPRGVSAPTPIAIAAGEEGVWVTDGVNGTVSRIREIDNQVLAPVRVGDIPTAVAVGLGSVWVTVNGEESPSPSTS
jgi:DNA-binding beta-propeller fold protein YncE